MFWLKRQLKKLRREATPCSTFKDALLLRIVGAPAPRFAFRFAAVGAAVVVLVFGMATGVYAYESPNVVDGHPLYFMKQKMEGVERRFATTSQARARFHAKMMERRLSEAERMAEDQEKLDAVLESAAEELDLSVEELKADQDHPKRKAIIDRLNEQSTRYENLRQRVPGGEGRKRLKPLTP